MVEQARFAGVDWATEEHAVCVVDVQGRIVEGRRYRHDERGIRALCERLIRLEVKLVAIERPDGHRHPRPRLVPDHLADLARARHLRPEPTHRTAAIDRRHSDDLTLTRSRGHPRPHRHLATAGRRRHRRLPARAERAALDGKPADATQHHDLTQGVSKGKSGSLSSDAFSKSPAGAKSTPSGTNASTRSLARNLQARGLARL
jgi:hypothetical protein